MMDCDEKLADATSKDLQRSTRCSLAEEEKEEEEGREEEEKRRERAGREGGGKLDRNERGRGWHSDFSAGGILKPV